MKIRYILIITAASIAWYIGAMEMPPPKRTSISQPSEAPTEAPKKRRVTFEPKTGAPFSIRYYLENRPRHFINRLKGNTLDLSGLRINSLEGLPEIPNITRVKILTLANNLVEKLSRSDFAGLRNLEVLNLSNNRFTKVPGYSFAELEGLKMLFLGNGKIEQIGR